MPEKIDKHIDVPVPRDAMSAACYLRYRPDCYRLERLLCRAGISPLKTNALSRRTVILSAVVAECVFVLECFYKHPRDKIAASLAVVISSPGVELAETETHLAALKHYTQTKLYFVDCLIAAHAAAAGLAVATFDKALLKITSRKL
ncbi:MAG: PIN domain-containing protein [Phycisphaerae bacterium]